MSEQLDRRAFLKAMGVAAGASFIPSAGAFAQDKKKDERENFTEPEGLTGEPLSLPEWKYGESSTSTETPNKNVSINLTFRYVGRSPQRNGSRSSSP